MVSVVQIILVYKFLPVVIRTFALLFKSSESGSLSRGLFLVKVDAAPEVDRGVSIAD